MGGEDGVITPINIHMKTPFSQYLFEARIAVPQSTLKEAMKTVSCALFSYVYTVNGGKVPPIFKEHLNKARKDYGTFKVYKLEDGQKIESTIQYDTKELPDNYRKNLKLQNSYPIKIEAGALPADDQGDMAYYEQMGRGKSGKIVVNLSMIPDIDEIGSVEGLESVLHDLEGIVAHELQHATQDVVLRKQHPDQMRTMQDGYTDDEYYGSQIENQPQITTAVNRFRKMLAYAKKQVEIDNATAQALWKAYVNPTAPMPPGTLKLKPYFQSDFFKTLYRTDKKKWQKAVKDFHRALQG